MSIEKLIQENTAALQQLTSAITQFTAAIGQPAANEKHGVHGGENATAPPPPKATKIEAPKPAKAAAAPKPAGETPEQLFESTRALMLQAINAGKRDEAKALIGTAAKLSDVPPAALPAIREQLKALISG